MAGIKEKISSALHKDHAHGDTGHTHGTGGLGTGTTGGLHSGHTSTGGTGLGTGTGTGLGTGHTSGTGTGLTSGTGTGLGSGVGTGTTGLTGHTHHHHHGTGELVGGSPQVIDSKVFTKTEDHEVLIEKKAYELQHHPVEKEYVVETRYVGEQRVPGAATELVGTEARQVEERVVEAPRGDREVIVENVDVPRELLQGQTHHHHTTGLGQQSGLTSTTGTTGTGTTGTGYGTTPGSTGNTTF